MSKEAFERKLAELEKLRSAPDAAQIRKALKDKSNYLVSKAAAVAADSGLAELIPDLLAAYDRFFVQPGQTDKQCWAKIALARALKQLEYEEPEPFLKGLYYVQMEPVWGGQEDTAATLRGECAHALIQCTLHRDEVLRLLVELLGDAVAPVRLDAVRAIAQLDGMDVGSPGTELEFAL